MATPKKTRVTPKRKSTVATAVKPVEISLDAAGKLSPKKIDLITAVSGWTMGDLFNADGSQTGKGLAAIIWLASREARPDLTPEMVYDCDDFAELGIEIAPVSPVDPTKAAG